MLLVALVLLLLVLFGLAFDDEHAPGRHCRAGHAARHGHCVKP